MRFALSLLLTFGAQLALSATSNATKHLTTQDGTTYAYDHHPAKGHKPTVLLIHGYPASRTDWAAQTAALTGAGFGVVAPDCLGYGESDKPLDIEAYHFKRLSGHFIEILDKEGLDTVVAVGHDWGSSLLSRVAVWYPKRFSKLAFLSAGYSPPGMFFDVDGLNALGLAQLGYMQLGYWYFLNSYDAGSLIGDNLEPFFSLAYPVNNTAWGQDLAALGSARSWLTAKKTTELPPWRTEADKAAWVALNGKANATEAQLNYYKSLMRGVQAEEEAVLTDEQRTLTVPVLGVGGAEDLVTRADQLRQGIEPWAAKGYAEKVVQGAGHWLILEKPDEVSKILIEFAQDAEC